MDPESIYSNFVKRWQVFPPLHYRAASRKTRLWIVIPAKLEWELERPLVSIASGRSPGVHVEVIYVLNYSESDYECESGRRWFEFATGYLNRLRYHLPEWLSLSIVYLPRVRINRAGAGYARRAGMDSALHKWAYSGFPSGSAIICLDADCYVAEDYLQKMYAVLAEGNLRVVHSNFMHYARSYSLYERSVLYELRLRYYSHALRYTGHPSPLYTIGSCFGVTPLLYMLGGGISVRRQGGEDFYFMHKCRWIGEYVFVADCFVYPEGRISFRIPFGTGRALSARDLELFIPFKAFNVIKQLVEATRTLSIDCLPPEAVEFSGKEFWSRLFDTARHSKGHFRYIWSKLGGLWTWRFLRFLSNKYGKQSIIESVCELVQNSFGYRIIRRAPEYLLWLLLKEERNLYFS